MINADDDRPRRGEHQIAQRFAPSPVPLAHPESVVPIT
jgi:hypothetical protein